ncbi:MAG: C25 family cysteine peptidase [Thermoplasmatota archaeon]
MVLLLFPLLAVPEQAQSGPLPPGRAEDMIPEEVPLGAVFPDLGPSYVIICPEEFKEEVIPLAVHRTRIGLPSRVYTIESIEGNFSGVDREQKVHRFLRAMHRNHSTFKWLFIVADSEHLMPRPLWHYAYDRGQPFENFYYSDVYYAGLDSDWDDDGDGRFGEYSVSGTIEGDIDWDIVVGRLPASTEVQAGNYVAKLLRYEKNPPLGSWMARFLNWASLMEPPNRDFDPYRYFDHKSNAYKVAMRVESNLPDHLEVKGLYDYPQLEGGNYTVNDGRDTLTRANMLSEFNGGASMLNFVGQARYEAYALNDYGPPTGNGTNWDWNEPLGYADHSLFSNGDMMPFMYASTCDTAKFFQTGFWEDKSLETWLTSPSGGVIGLISSTGTSARGEETTLSWGNWYLDEEFWKMFLNGGETHPGRTMYLLKEQYRSKWLSPTMEIKETILGMIYTYILLGDPYVDVYTDQARRFMGTAAIGTTFYTGNHTVRFRVYDRDQVPVPYPQVTIYNEDLYIVLNGNAQGWVNSTLDLGDSSGINLTLSGHNMVHSFYKYPVHPAVSDVYISDSYGISPVNASLGDPVKVTMEVGNRGGMTAENVGLHILLEGGSGDPSGPYASFRLGDIEPGASMNTSFNWTVRPGDHSFSLNVDSTSQEVDLMNNHLKIGFSSPGPIFEFSADSGRLRPSSMASPGTSLLIDLSVINLGFTAAPLEVQLFDGDPDLNGTPMSDVLPLGVIEVDGYGNASIPFEAPGADALLFIIMDPLDRYPPGFLDEPVKSLLRIDLPPRWSGPLSMAILEDSLMNTLPLDAMVTDDDTMAEDLVFSIVSSDNMSARIRDMGEEGKVLVCEPPQDWWGDASVVLSVTDGMTYVETIVEITVDPVNDPPFFLDAVQGIIELSTLEDEPFSFLLRGGDIDSQLFSFHYGGDTLSVDRTTGLVTWDPVQNDVGDNEFQVIIRDDAGAESVLLLRIDVVGVNDPPSAQPVQDVTLDEGATARVVLNVTDEEGDPLSFGSNTPIIWFDTDGSVQINGSSEHIGVNDVRIAISDGVNTIYVKFNVTIVGGGGKDGNGSSLDVQTVMGGIGIAVAVIALLFLGLMLIRKSPVDEQVMMELEGADELYEEDIASLVEEYEEGIDGEG